MYIIAVGTETLGKEGLPARRKGRSLKTILTIIILTLRTKLVNELGTNKHPSE